MQFTKGEPHDTHVFTWGDKWKELPNVNNWQISHEDENKRKEPVYKYLGMTMDAVPDWIQHAVKQNKSYNTALNKSLNVFKDDCLPPAMKIILKKHLVMWNHYVRLFYVIFFDMDLMEVVMMAVHVLMVD